MPTCTGIHYLFGRKSILLLLINAGCSITLAAWEAIPAAWKSAFGNDAWEAEKLKTSYPVMF